MQLINYIEVTEKYLEYLDYPNMVVEFDFVDVAKSISKVMVDFFLAGYSPRLCAIVIWSLTMNYHIIPLAQKEIKH